MGGDKGGHRTDLDSGVMKLEACWSQSMVCVIIKTFRKGLQCGQIGSCGRLGGFALYDGWGVVLSLDVGSASVGTNSGVSK